MKKLSSRCSEPAPRSDSSPTPGSRQSTLGHPPSVIGYRPSAIGYWLLAIGYWLLAIGYLLLAPISSADSLWNDPIARPMLADKRASKVGDLLTVVVQENNSASKDKNTKTSKSAGMDASIASFFYSPAASGLLSSGGQMPALKYNSKNDFEGGGSINNAERIIARLAVRVIDVLPNRNLVIEGSRETAFSGEQQTIVLRGVVRPEDIAANNSVYSYNISDAAIKFVSKGQLSDSQKKGWWTRIWDKVSPF